MKASICKKSLAAALGACFLAGLFSLYIQKPPNPDQGIFDYIGWIGMTGGTYYVDVAEQNFPGEMLLHELALRLFGISIHAYRALDFFIAAIGAAALYALLHASGFDLGSAFGAAFYLAGYVSSNGWMSGQRDVVAANLLLVAGVLFLRRLKGGSRLWITPLSVLLFFAVLLRPTYLLFAAGLMAIDMGLLRRNSRSLGTSLADAALVGIHMAAGAAALVGWGAHAGFLPAFVEQVLQFNIQAYDVGHSRIGTLAQTARNLTGYALFLPAAVLAALRAERDRRRDAPMLILGGLVLLALTSSFVQNKGFGYHLGALLPPLFGLAGVAVWIGARALLEHRGDLASRAAACAAALGIIGLLCQARSLGPQIRYVLGRETQLQMLAKENGGQEGFTWADMRNAADYARSATDPNETILVWGRPVSIHILAQRRSPTRFITYGMLTLAKPPFEHCDDWVGEFAEALRQRPPRLIFLPAMKGEANTEAIPLSEDGSASTEVLRQVLAARFSFAGSFGSMHVYRLR